LDGHYLTDLQVSPKLIHGVLALSGVYNLANSESQESVFGKDQTVRRDASPLHHVRADAPPFLVTYCQWDYFSLPAQARAFYRALQQAGVKTELVYIPRESHISEIMHISNQGDPTATAALQFMH
jgi:acetyl esterase/lipase